MSHIGATGAAYRLCCSVQTEHKANSAVIVCKVMLRYNCGTRLDVKAV